MISRVTKCQMRTWLETLKALEARPQSAPRMSTSGSSNMLCSSYSGTLKAGDVPSPAWSHPAKTPPSIAQHPQFYRGLTTVSGRVTPELHR